MADGKKSFVAYCDWEETFNALPDDKAGQLIKHLLAYVNDRNPETKDVLINAVFANIKYTLKRDLKKYEYICEKRSKAGIASGLKRKQKGTKRTRVKSVEQIGTKRTDSDSDIKEEVKYSKNEDVDRAFKEYLQLRLKIKCQNTDRVINRLLKFLRDNTNDPKEAIEIINKAITCSWKDFYPLKYNGK
jgi:hypothetical protein